MDKILLVLKNELYRVILRPSFLIMLFLVPIISFSIAAISSAGQGGEDNPVNQIFVEEPEVIAEGYVDYSGLVKGMPEDLSGSFKPFADEVAANQALSDGDISAYYVLPEDFLENGTVIYYRPDFNPLSNETLSSGFEEAVRFNLMGQDVQLAERYKNPLGNMERVYLSDVPQRDQDDMLTFFVPYVVMLVFYIVIFGSASLMLNSITDEKQNRVMEILMTSIRPVQLLTGKIIALGLVGLLQTVVWFGAGFLLLTLSGRQLELSFELPASILFWGVIFFVLGYGVYAALMAGVGALVPSLKEASQATLMVLIPLIIPMMMISALVEAPNGGLAVGLSLFPLTAPVVMMTRLAASSAVPIWQILLSVALLLLTNLFILRSVAGMFRAQNLISGQAFNLKVFVLALLGKA